MKHVEKYNPLEPPYLEGYKFHVHEWVVFSTHIADVCLLVECVQCGALGRVVDPTKEEWCRDYLPYEWTENDRVVPLPVEEILR